MPRFNWPFASSWRYLGTLGKILCQVGAEFDGGVELLLGFVGISLVARIVRFGRRAVGAMPRLMWLRASSSR